MAEPELKSRSRESVAKAASQEKMGGRYSARSHFCRHHMVQCCINPPCALMQQCLMQESTQANAAMKIHLYDLSVCSDDADEDDDR